MNGLGVDQSDEKAFVLFEAAAKQGDLAAIGRLAQCYEYGRGVAKNEYLASKWYRIAAEAGDAGALRKCEELAGSATKKLDSLLRSDGPKLR